MAKRNDMTKRPSVRPTEDQLRKLKERAVAREMSVNQYLLVCGLSDGYVPNVEELELRERAVFEIRWAVHELSKINRRLDRSFEVSSEKVNSALDQTLEAARLVGAAFGEKEAAQEDR